MGQKVNQILRFDFLNGTRFALDFGYGLIWLDDLVGCAFPYYYFSVSRVLGYRWVIIN